MSLMRRSLLAIALATAVLLTGCGTVSKEKRTLTVVASTTHDVAPAASSTPPAAVSAAKSSVASASQTSQAAGSTSLPPSSPSAQGPSGSSSAQLGVSSAPESSSVAAGPLVKVDPLKANCAELFSAADARKVFGSPIPEATKRILDVANANVGSTGKLRCQYGVEGSSVAVAIGLTQYVDLAAATKQIGVTAAAEKKAGAKEVTAAVNGHPATVLIRDGGLLSVTYDTWVLAIAVDAKLGGQDPQQNMVSAAELVLNRVLKAAK